MRTALSAKRESTNFVRSGGVPFARFDAATDVLGRARVDKGAEEIA
jgi:hypothetical protein